MACIFPPRSTQKQKIQKYEALFSEATNNAQEYLMDYFETSELNYLLTFFWNVYVIPLRYFLKERFCIFLGAMAMTYLLLDTSHTPLIVVL